MKNKRSISSVLATTLVLLLIVLIIANYNIWFTNYGSNLLAEAETTETIELTDINKIANNKIFINNPENNSISVLYLKINNETCESNFSLTDGLNEVDLAYCLNGLEDGYYNILLITDQGVFDEVLYLEQTEILSFTITFVNSKSCTAANTSKIYGLSQLNSAHVEKDNNNTFNYSTCATHRELNISNNCVGNYQLLFYIDTNTNSHVWNDTSSPYTPSGYIYDWQPICINSVSGEGTLLKRITTNDLSNQDYSCIASLSGQSSNQNIIDNYYGNHVADCNTYNLKVWVKLT